MEQPSADTATRGTRILLLLPSATYRASDFMRAAGRLGAEVVVASDGGQALASVMGGRALSLCMDDLEGSVERIARRADALPLDAVVAVDDQGVEIAAAAAARLGLPHNPPAAAAATRDKARLREVLGVAGLTQPRWALVGRADDAGAVAATVGFPAVVKPRTLAASRGVIRVDDATGARRAVSRIRGILREAGEDDRAPLLVERFVPGAEVAVEGLLRGGELEILAIFDKPDPLDGPYFEETLYITPSRHPVTAQAAVRSAVGRAVAAVGLREGPVHAELRLADTGPVLLEIAARSIGGLCARTLRFGAGVSLEDLIVRHAAGLELPAHPRELAAAGVLMLPIPRSGRLVGVDGQTAARAVPGVEGLEVTIPRGRAVRPLPEGDRYLGFVFARGSTPAEVEAALRAAHACLRIDIDPEPGP